MSYASLVVLFSLLGDPNLNAPPELRRDDVIRISEARRISQTFGEFLWPGWSSAPFSLILVTPDVEFLMFHQNPPEPFKSLSYDPRLGTQIYVRPRTYSTNLLASFPAVQGVATIVVGQPEYTEAKASLRWVISILHEHFHQMQTSNPTYYKEVEALNLARGDQTGMWMLNYDFPYKSPEVNKAFSELSTLLLKAIKARGLPSFRGDVDQYLAARKRFQQILSVDDFNYFSLQIWQEGVARYTELRMSELIRERYTPTMEFQKLDDMSTLASEVEAQRAQIMRGLDKLSLVEQQRVVFYTFGSAEALLLDTVAPSWKRRYLSEKFYMERYFR